MTDSPIPKPAHTLRLGLLQAAIWSNTGQHGPFYNVTFERRYRDAKEEWQSGASFGRDDLLALAKLADQAHSWVIERFSNEREHGGNGAADAARSSANSRRSR